MALFYYIIDYKKKTKGLNWLKIYGMNSHRGIPAWWSHKFQKRCQVLCFGDLKNILAIITRHYLLLPTS